MNRYPALAGNCINTFELEVASDLTEDCQSPSIIFLANAYSGPFGFSNALLQAVIEIYGVPYGNRTRVAAVKEKRFTGIQRKPAAWIAP